MSILDNMKTVAMKSTGPLVTKMKMRSPEILMGLGVTAVATSGVLLVRQTLRVQPILHAHEDELEFHKSGIITPTYSEEDMKKDIAKTYVRTGVKLIKHYGPAVTIGLAGLTALLASNGILRQRNVALVAAYKAVETSFSNYRDRVRSELGEDKELDIYRGFTQEKIANEETGKKELKTVVDPNGFSIYAKYFDEASPYWSKTPEYNLVFLRGKQSYFNDYLRAHKVLLLKDVYKELGIPITQASTVVGWKVDADSDNYVDFGIYDFSNAANRDFVNGYEKNIRLDFNVSGVVIDAFPEL